MSNAHPRPPAPFGTETPDGGLMLRPEEARWLRDVFSRIDIARAEIIEAYYEKPDLRLDLRSRVMERLRCDVARHVESVVDTFEEPRTDEDKGRGFTRLRGALTIIRGGLPPRPAF